jgi:uncharacterized protein YndB with AHSA1/START domain
VAGGAFPERPDSFGRCAGFVISRSDLRKGLAMAHRFEIDRQIEVGATPEQVWEAITTGPGLDSWFMGRSEIEPREGGTARVSAPGWTMESTVTTWDPPHRFAQRGEEGEDGTLHQFEYTIEPRGNGSKIRWLHSGFLGGDWEAEYEAMGEGDPMYLHKLAQYLTYFLGRTGTPIDAFGPMVAPGQMWGPLRSALGISPDAGLDDPVPLTPVGFEPVVGVIDYLSPSFLGVRSGDVLYRFIHAFEGMSMIGHHDFTPDVDKEAADAAWGAWLAQVFA